jgi:membrane protein implicated in regulation of membrane protease activity
MSDYTAGDRQFHSTLTASGTARDGCFTVLALAAASYGRRCTAQLPPLFWLAFVAVAAVVAVAFWLKRREIGVDSAGSG